MQDSTEDKVGRFLPTPEGGGFRAAEFGDKDAAIRVFYFVRDRIAFGSSDLYGKASHTLQVGIGDCGLKANVQMTLLRAAGIPSRLHLVLARAPAVVNAIFPSWIASILPEVMGHVWCECRLSGKWIGCDATFDKHLFEALVKNGLVPENAIPTIDWNGETNLTPIAPWVTQDLGVCASYDQAIETFSAVKGRGGLPPRLIVKLFGWVFDASTNRRLDRIRESFPYREEVDRTRK